MFFYGLGTILPKKFQIDFSLTLDSNKHLSAYPF